MQNWDHWARRWARAIERPRLLVVGGASLDSIHVGGEPMPTPGGAGLYTALAAARAGVEVTMLAPVPWPMPPELERARELIRWIGPAVPVDELPRFEIAYDDNGDVTLFREFLGAEPDMTPDLLDLVDDLPAAAYCVPFLDANLQREFVRELARRGCLTIAATYGKAVREERDVVHATFELADISFCNADEANVLFTSTPGHFPEPRTGHFRFITRSAQGCSVYQGAHRTDVPTEQVRALDPTGAGDTFCGTTVARLLLGDHPVEAARKGNAAAARMVTMLGPAALWTRDTEPPTLDPRARPDDDQVDRMADLMRTLPEVSAFDFTGELFPEVGDPDTIRWFSAATLGQFGFWYEHDGRHAGPMIAPIDGTPRKGSDYLWAVYRRWQATELDPFSPEGQANLDEDTWLRLTHADDGTQPFPDDELWITAARAYGRTLTALAPGADELVEFAAQQARPVRTLLSLLDHVGGYREDPLRKKAALLCVILRQRPEQFLPVAPDDDVPPIVDYHVQRSCLRTGMVRIDDSRLWSRLVDRVVVEPDEEEAVRRAAFAAVARLSVVSGRDMGAVDWFLFQMRHRCPEMTAPDCSACPADPACGHHTTLFQPVFRTTAY
ncbi:MAG: carbohydrate kinase family protein [Ilumatobacteraceae bacterium]